MTTVLNILRFIRKMRKSVGPNLRLNVPSVSSFVFRKDILKQLHLLVSVTNAVVQDWFLVDFAINREQRLVLVLEDS